MVPNSVYPRFVVGERECPPEECGSIPGFYEMLEARADPAHPDHAEISQWLKEYDPDALDDFPIHGAFGRIAARRNAAAKCIVKPASDCSALSRPSPDAYGLQATWCFDVAAAMLAPS